MKGYKAFNSDLTCRGFQFEIGKTYEHDGNIVPCESGFHFCKSIADCYKFYEMSDETRICKVKAIGNIKTYDNVKYCTDKITILSEVKKPKLKSNTSDDNSGYCNSGRYNTGNCNSSHCNSGNKNSGIYNSGNCNSGDFNSGNYNSGDSNTGSYNFNDRNTGNWNFGYCNSGNKNSGNCNSGEWNSGSCNSGVFNTEKNPTIKIFDKESDWTIDDWFRSEARRIMEGCPCSYYSFIYEELMTDEEKEIHPEYKTIGGFTKFFEVTEDDRQVWWDKLLTAREKQTIKELPNFDENKFKECTGITI